MATECHSAQGKDFPAPKGKIIQNLIAHKNHSPTSNTGMPSKSEWDIFCEISISFHEWYFPPKDVPGDGACLFHSIEVCMEEEGIKLGSLEGPFLWSCLCDRILDTYEDFDTRLGIVLSKFKFFLNKLKTPNSSGHI